jgi:hypothetical protein
MQIVTPVTGDVVRLADTEDVLRILFASQSPWPRNVRASVRHGGLPTWRTATCSVASDEVIDHCAVLGVVGAQRQLGVS